MSKIIVFIEQRNNQIKKSSYEAINAANTLAGFTDSSVEVLIIGSDIENIDSLLSYNISKVTHLKNEDLELYSSSAYKDLIAEYAADADYLIFTHTAMGKDLAPRVAIKISANIAVDVTGIEKNDDQILFSRPVFAGKAVTKVKLSSDKQIISVRPNLFREKVEGTGNPELEVKEVSNLNLANRVSEIEIASQKLDVAEADIIVSGGRGMKGPENFGMIEELAELFGGATGASRAAVDAGWRPHSEQVGQTGKNVSPSLYIAVGISGAIQHLAGMRTSKYIVAINKDPEAPIFSVADYGITGDLFEVVPALIDELKKNK